MRTIKIRIMMFVGSLLLIICSGLGFIAYNTSSNALISNARDTMPRFAIEASKIIELGILKNLSALESTAANEKIAGMEGVNSDKQDIMKVMDSEIKRSGHLRMAVITGDGTAVYNDGKVENLKDTDYFKMAMAGEDVVTDPVRIGTDDSIMIIYAVPIKHENKVAGVLIAMRDGYELSQLASEITYGDSGKAFIVNKKGNTIAHADKNVIASILKNKKPTSVDGNSSASLSVSSSNSKPAEQKDSKAGSVDANSSASISGSDGEDSSGFKNFANLQNQMVEGRTDFGEYEYNGIPKYMGFAPVASLGWSVAVEVDRSEVLSRLNSLKIKYFAVSLIFLLVSFIVAYMIATNIDKPIAYLTGECEEMAKGDFRRNIKGKYTKRKDEIGELARAFQTITFNLGELIKGASKASRQVASSSEELTATIHQSSVAAEEVARTIEEIAKGANKQAEDTEQGADKVSEMGRLIEEEQRYMEELNKSADEVNTIKEEGFQILRELVEKTEVSNKAAREVYDVIVNTNESAAKIEKASHMIRSISEQTNILALNAAIEAARAGDTGRGFAVVAEEIRKLAEESNKFTKQITLVIKELMEKASGAVNTIQEVSRTVISQTESVEMTRAKFDGIASAIEKTKVVIDTLYKSGLEMVDKKEEMVDIIQSLSAISEQNAAGTEEASASVEEQTTSMADIAEASEALARLAEEMNQSISKFKY